MTGPDAFPAVNRQTRLVLGAYVLLALGPVVWVLVTHGSFWHHAAALVAVLLIFLIVLAAVLLRQRWAWLPLTAVNSYAVVSIIWESATPLAYADSLVSFALLLSPPMRNHVRGRYQSERS